MEINAIPLFRGIDQRDLPGLLSSVEAAARTYEKGALLLGQGERTSRLGVVLSGGVHIVREDFWGNRTIVGLAAEGDLFAESYACLPDIPLEVSVWAAEDTEVLYLNAERAAGTAHRQLSRNLMTLMAEKNLMLTRKMGHMARRTTRDKLLSYLSAQALLTGASEFDIPLDRQQLADYLAVDRSAMSTELGKLRDEGILTFRKNHFHLLQEEA